LFEVVQQQHPDFSQTQSFVHERFRLAYGADIQAFMPSFVRVKHADGRVRAVLGYRGANEGKLYLEHYLDDPIEVTLSRYLGHGVSRREIVELGNLAEVEPGDARMVIIGATAFFHRMGFRWVVFTGVTRLRNAFARLGLAPKQLIEVDESRLPPDEREQWGSYYKGDPVVCFGSLQEGHDNLQELWASLRDTWAAAEEAGDALRDVASAPADAEAVVDG